MNKQLAPVFSGVFPVLVLLLTAAAAEPAVAQRPTRAFELRDLALAELENEHPERAEPLYRELAKLIPQDPLPPANLAIALLRQQKNAEARKAIDAALALAPGRPELLAIRAEVEQWSGDLAAAIATLDQVVAGAPDEPELLYAAYQLATTSGDAAAAPLAAKSLDKLVRLRPDNLVLLLQLGQRQIQAGDRVGATATYLRVGELLWQASPLAQTTFAPLRTALEKNDLAAAKVPAARLENVLKVSPMFRESLRELKTGIQGIPLKRLQSEPAPQAFGEPLAIQFEAHPLDPAPGGGRALAAGDFDRDGRPDLAWIKASGELEIRLAAKGWAAGAKFPAAELWDLEALDLDNDGYLDLVAFGAKRGAGWRGRGDGSFEDATAAWGLGAAAGRVLAAFDYDIEGDLDLVLAGAGAGPLELWRNNLQGPLEKAGARIFPPLAVEPKTVAASDLDRDGDLDLLLGHGQGLTWLDNLRQGRFTDRTESAGLTKLPYPENWGPEAAAISAVAVADFDHDGRPDIAYANGGTWIRLARNLGDRFEEPEILASGPLGGADAVIALTALDADNDGRLDLLAAGFGGLTLLHQQPADRRFQLEALRQAPGMASRVVPVDLDRDGDLDLAVSGREGLIWLENQGGNGNRWLEVSLRGLKDGNSKNNLFGQGAVIEVKNGDAYQFREAEGESTHFGLGKAEKAAILRVVWTNGVPQNRLGVSGNQSVTEEQVLKGSCPFLYAWDGEKYTFVTDLLWGAPIGLPAAPGVWVGSDPSELVRIDGLVLDGGKARLRVSEELWEAAFFDQLKLWVVDHPAEVQAASNLRIVPGQASDERVLALRDLRPVAAAWDGRGREVTAEVAARDEVYADGYGRSPYQGVAKEWAFTFELGEAPAGPLRLLLEGWIFPADASLNLAVAQRNDYPWLPPRLEVETREGWQVLMPAMGFPAGKTKAMVVDTPPLPAGASRLRIVSSFWLHWDRLAWSKLPAAKERELAPLAKILPSRAELRFRGFSALARKAPNAPHAYDYQKTTTASPWLPFPGRYTRYGDVLELLAEPDDASVILAPGDEIDLELDLADLPPPAPGMTRTFFLESHGWDKDADRNTGEGQRLGPLPFRAMKSYPYAPGESWPDDDFHRRYVDEWLTRDVGEP